MQHPTRHRLAHPWARNERGESVVTVLVGALIGTIIIGGFFAFWMRTNDTGNQVADHASQQAAGVESLNRISRDVRAANMVLKADDKELILQKRNGNGTYTRTRYLVDPTTKELRSQVMPPSTDGDNPVSWTSAAKVVARNVNTANTKFDYVAKDGSTLTEPVAAADLSKVKLVKIDFDAKAGDNGRVAMRSAAALDAGEGDTVTPADRNDPKANNDTIRVRKNGSAVTVNVLTNDECPAGAAAGSCTAGTVTLAQTTAAATGITITPNGAGGFSIQATSAYSGADLTPTNESFEYVITDAEGDTDGAVVDIRVVPPPKAPDAVDNGVAQPVGSSRTSGVLGNDQCDDGEGVLTLGCPKPPTDPVVTIVSALPSGVTASVDAQGRIVTNLAEGYGSATGIRPVGSDDVRIDYRLIDGSQNPALDGNDANTLPGDDATLTLYPGPAARNDIATVQADAGGVIDIFANDRMNTGTTLAWVTALPSWITAGAGGSLTLNPDDGHVGTHTLTYRLDDPRGGWGLSDTGTLTITVTAGPPPVSVNAGAYNFADTDGNGLADAATNRIAMTGGNGAYKLFRATQVDASGRPTGTIVKVCDSTDAVTTNDCANPVDDNVSLSSGWQYIAYDSRTPDPTVAAPACGSGVATCARKRYSNDYVVTFPQDPRLLGFGSDADNNGEPERQGVNTLHWVKNNAFSEVGIRQRIMTPNWGFVELLDANQTDLGIQQLSSTDCAGMWGSCLRLGGQTPGSERIYQAYALTQTEAAGTDVSNRCDVYPGSPITPRNYGGVTYCPSPAQGQGMGYNLNYTNEVVRGNGNAGGSDTDGNANSRARDAIRLYQAPSGPVDFIMGDRSNGDPVNGYGVVSEACPDVTRGDANFVYSCRTNVAMAAFTVHGNEGSTSANGGGYCGQPGDPGNCYGYFQRAEDGWSSGPVEMSTGCGGWCEVRTDSQWLGARAYGGTDNWRGRNCNYGGCSTNGWSPVRMYAQQAGIRAGAQVVPADQDQKYNHWDIGPDCWDHGGWRGGCYDDYLPSLTYNWTASAGVDHYSVGTFQDIGKSFDWNQAGGACYNTGWAAAIRPEDGGAGAHIDGRVARRWHSPTAEMQSNNQGYRWCVGRYGDPRGQYHTSNTINVSVGSMFTLVADPIAANGLRQRSELTFWPPGPRPGFLGSGVFCNENVGTDWWRLGSAVRTSGQILDGADNASRTSNYWERLSFIGPNTNGDFFRGSNTPATNLYWPGGWENDRYETRLYANSGSGYNNTWQVGGGGEAFVVRDMGVGAGGIMKSMMFDNNNAYNVYALHGQPLVAMQAFRSYSPPNDLIKAGAQAGSGWNTRTMVGNQWSQQWIDCNPVWDFNSYGSPYPNWRNATRNDGTGMQWVRLHWKVNRNDGWAGHTPRNSGNNPHLDFANPYL